MRRKKSSKAGSKFLVLIEAQLNGKWGTWQVCLNLKKNGQIESFTAVKDRVTGKLCLLDLPPGILSLARRAYSEALAAAELEDFWTAGHYSEDRHSGWHEPDEGPRDEDDNAGEGWKRGAL